jgi:protein TonB
VTQLTTLLSGDAHASGIDPIKTPVIISGIGHGILLVAAIWGAVVGRNGAMWGEGSATGGTSATVKLVSSASIPLPPPTVVTTNKVANEEPGIHYSEAPKPQPKPAPERAIELPGKNARRTPPVATPTPPRREMARLHRLDKEPVQTNEIPYGAGGPVQGPYGMFRSDAGTGGFAFDESAGDFGSRFGWYVTAIRGRISSNWLQSTIDPNIHAAPRLFVTFTILRDGQVVNAQITQSSGVASLDRSAVRAVMDSNPMPGLPPDYRSNSVAVEFWFDFRR